MGKNVLALLAALDTACANVDGIGLAAIRSEVYRNVHNTFHVDQHR
jgi:hypothetical protein